MGKFGKLVEDYSNVPVPDRHTVAGFRVGFTLIGVSIALPAFLQGSQIGLAMGFQKSAVAFALGGVLLAILGCFTGIIGARSRLSTNMLIRYAFGETGGKLVNLVITGTLLGWYGVNSYLFGEAAVGAASSLHDTSFSFASAIIAGSVLMVAATIFGFKLINRLTLVVVPVLLMVLIYVIWVSLSRISWTEVIAVHHGNMTMGVAVSAVIGSYMVGVTLFPDLTRFVANRDQAIIASVVGLAIGFPLILISAAIPSLATGNGDLMTIIEGAVPDN